MSGTGKERTEHLVNSRYTYIYIYIYIYIAIVATYNVYHN